MTLAPELPGAMELVAEARRCGVVVATGHTEATFDQARAAFAAGANLVTHLFNAMPPLDSRAPGVVGAAVAPGGPCASIIVDGVHVHPANVELAVRALGPQRTVLVTDAMPPMGTDNTEGRLWDARLIVRGGACYLENGTLAGSILTMADAVRNVMAMANIPLADAVAMASSSPARVLGIDGRKGCLAPGMDADLIVCDDQLDVLLTLVEGRVAYRSPSLQRARL